MKAIEATWRAAGMEASNLVYRMWQNGTVSYVEALRFRNQVWDWIDLHLKTLRDQGRL